MLERTLSRWVSRVLNDYGKMAFVSGPRQVGKTVLADALGAGYPGSVYFNWDVASDQKRLLADPYFFTKEDREPGRPLLVTFDEIHKFARWKNYLKGAYDAHKGGFRFIVTGSGRLDLYRKGGDSMLGRYMTAPLFPLTVGELLGRLPSAEDFLAALSSLEAPPTAARGALDSLLALSGFPEPFVRGEQSFYRAWAPERKKLLVREDIRDASRMREISLLELLSQLIPERVGGPLSLNSLREDLKVTHDAVSRWVDLLEGFYYLFRVPPHAGGLARALRKEPKAYLYDWIELAQEGPRFENLIALHLLKAVSLWRVMGQGQLDLRYARDKEKRETDFVLLEKGKPLVLLECKTGELGLDPSLLRFQRLWRVPVAVQVVLKPGVCRKQSVDGGTQWVVSAERLLAALP